METGASGELIKVSILGGGTVSRMKEKLKSWKIKSVRCQITSIVAWCGKGLHMPLTELCNNVKDMLYGVFFFSFYTN